MNDANALVRSRLEMWVSRVAVVLCVAMLLGVALDVAPAVRGPIALVFVCFVPGWTAVVLFRVRDPLREIALVVATSLATLTLVAELMLLFDKWSPVNTTYIVAGTCAVLLLAMSRADSYEIDMTDEDFAVVTPEGLAPSPPVLLDAAPSHGTATALLANRSTGVLAPEPVVIVDDSVDVSADPPPPTSVATQQRGWWVTLFLLALIGVAITLWILSLNGARVGTVSGLGLVSEMPATYFLALGVLTLGFALALAARAARERTMLLYTAALVMMLHATTAILYPEPRYAWTYKHLGVIDYISVHGRVDRSIDIYHSWPGFFAINAWFSRMSGWAPIDYAPWAQPVFEVANVAALVFCFRGLTRDPRRIWAAVWIFLIVNWLGQDYLAPQAFGFFVGLVVTGLVLRCTQRRWPPSTRVGRRWARTRDRLSSKLRVEDFRERPYDAPVTPRAAFAIGTVCFAAIVVTHQLSPYLVVAGVLFLVVLREARPVWLPFAMAAMALAWLGEIGLEFVSRHFGLLNFGDQVRAHPAGFTGARALPGVALDDAAKFGVVLCLLVAACLGTMLRARRRHTDVVVVALVFGPATVAAVQSYDGEGWLRALLFALPWLSFLAAAVVTEPIRRAHDADVSSWRAVRLVVLSAVLIPAMLLAYFGEESVNYISRDDVAVNRWYLDHAPNGSVVAFVASNSPARLSARYASMDVGDVSTTLTDVVALRHNAVKQADAATVADLLRRQKGTRKYLVSSPSEKHYLEYFGIVPHGWVDQLLAALRESPAFRVVYRSGSAEVFELR